MSVEKKIVLKIGGSTLYTNGLNINFPLLEKVKAWYYEAKKEYSKIVIVVGGGSLSREMQSRVGNNIQQGINIHNIAMSVTQTNALVVYGYLNDTQIFVPKKLGDAYEYLLTDGSQSLISGGLKVGWSTDMDAAIFADIIDTDRVIKISDIDYLYDKNPKQFQDAKVIKDITWDDYFKLFNITDDDEHQANIHIPVDKICSRFAKNKGLSFYICGGANIQQKNTIKEIISDGTSIH